MTKTRMGDCGSGGQYDKPFQVQLWNLPGSTASPVGPPWSSYRTWSGHRSENSLTSQVALFCSFVEMVQLVVFLMELIPSFHWLNGGPGLVILVELVWFQWITVIHPLIRTAKIN